MNIQLNIIPNSAYQMPPQFNASYEEESHTSCYSSGNKQFSTMSNYSFATSAMSDRKQDGAGQRKLNILSTENKKVLLSYFEMDPEWTKATVELASKATGVIRSKVYKWGSDRKRYLLNKMRKNAKKAQFTKDYDCLNVSDGVDLNMVVSDLIGMIDNEFTYCQQLLTKPEQSQKLDNLTNSVTEYSSVDSSEIKHKVEAKNNDLDLFVSDCASDIASDDLLDRRLGFLPADKKSRHTDLFNMSQMSTDCQLNLDFSDLGSAAPASQYLEF